MRSYLYSHFRLLSVFAITAVISYSALAKKGDDIPQSASVKENLQRLDYLLAIDRLDFYADALADYLMDHEKPQEAEAIRQITPEDIAAKKISFADLNNNSKWNQLLLDLMKHKFPALSATTLNDINWNYQFLRNKLMEGFKAEPVAVKSSAVTYSIATQDFSLQPIPEINGDKVLLDTGRYISEKTTRAIYWDALVSGKEIEYHLGTEKDFRERIASEKRNVVAEVKTRARNYNKIYLVEDSQGKLSYAFTRISGQDRITHLLAQLRLTSFEAHKTLKSPTAKVYGTVEEVHKRQEQALVDMFSRLPEADLVVIGQKSAIEGVIAAAGMMAQLQPDLNKTVDSMNPAIAKLSQRVTQEGSYFAVTGKSSIVKSGFEVLPDPMAMSFEAFQSEQPSHDIADVLLQTKNGEVVRWRLVSNMWGDEVVPLANALRKTSHKKVVYIGTAGALVDKGLEVGDVVSPKQTYTQDGRILPLEKGDYWEDKISADPNRLMTLGQVRSPFDETDKWFETWKTKIDVVELETGYLKDHLGKGVSFQPYLLISDIVGSVHQTLAVAASDSSKRKNGQMKLVEKLFSFNGIQRPISNFQPLPGGAGQIAMFKRIQNLRPSRDLVSIAQLSELAIRAGAKTNEDLEKLIKSEKSFTRNDLILELDKISQALDRVQDLHKMGDIFLIGPDSLMAGHFNPKEKYTLKLVIPEGDPSWTKILANNAKMILGMDVEVTIKSPEELTMALRITEDVRGNFLADNYELRVLRKWGLNLEHDAVGGVRARENTELKAGNRCETVFIGN